MCTLALIGNRSVISEPKGYEQLFGVESHEKIAGEDQFIYFISWPLKVFPP